MLVKESLADAKLHNNWLYSFLKYFIYLNF